LQRGIGERIAHELLGQAVDADTRSLEYLALLVCVAADAAEVLTRERLTNAA